MIMEKRNSFVIVHTIFNNNHNQRSLRMSNNPHEANNWIHMFIITMVSALYKPGRRWFSQYIVGALLACSSTVASWIRGIGDERRYKKLYHLQRIGKQTPSILKKHIE